MRKLNYRRAGLTGLLLVITLFSYSRDSHKADSLIQLLDQKLNDKDKAEILLKISRFVEIDSATYYTNSALDLAEELSDKLLKARILEEKSLIERKLGNTVAAFQHSFMALDIYQDLGLSKRVALLNEQIGSHYLYDKNYKKAIHHLKIAIDGTNTFGDTIDIALIAINLGEAYRVSEQFDSAAYYFQLALDYDKIRKHHLIFAYGMGNLGLVNSAKGETNIALRQLDSALNILTDLGDDYAASYYKSEIGKIYVNEGKETEGEKILLESLETSESIGLKEQIKDISKILSEHYERKGSFQKALIYRKQYESFADSLQNLDNVRQIESLRADQAINQKQQELEYLDQINSSTKKLNLALGIGLFGLTTLSILLYTNFQRLRQSHKKTGRSKKGN